MDKKPLITLKACRANSGMSQDEWAKMLGVSVATVMNWEQYKHKIPVDKLVIVSRLSKVPLDLIILCP